MADMFPSVSCLVSPRNGEAPLSLKENVLLYYKVCNMAVTVVLELFVVHLQDVGDDADAPHVCFQTQRLVVHNLWCLKGRKVKRQKCEQQFLY